MSLVNDLLRDLEGRQQPPVDGSQGAAPVEREQREHPVAKFGLLAVLVLALLYGGYWLVSTTPHQADKPEPRLAAVPLTPPPQTVPARDSAKQNPDDQAMDAATMQSVAAAMGVDTTPTATGSADESAPDPIDETIETLLDEARLALAKDHLTTPVDDNAYSRYRSVLYMQPDNARALDGLKNIAARYLALHQHTLDQNAPRLANSYLDKGHAVTRTEPSLQQWWSKELDRLPKTMEPRAELAEKEPVADSNSKPSVTEAERPVQAKPVVSEETVVNRARRLMARSRWSDAQQMLASYVANHPEDRNTLSRVALFDAYLGDGELNRAEQLVAQMDFLGQQRRAYLQGRVLAKRGDFTAALNLLRDHAPAPGSAPEHHALIAGLHHQLGDYENAAATYRQLLKAEPERNTYWLGLAVSLDALNDTNGALQAFRYAKLYGRPDESTRSYIDERIAALSR